MKKNKISRKMKSRSTLRNKKKTAVERPMVTKVSKTEFELSDGRVFPMMFDFADDEIPTPEEFQKQYDRWLTLFTEMELTGNEQSIT